MFIFFQMICRSNSKLNQFTFPQLIQKAIGMYIHLLISFHKLYDLIHFVFRLFTFQFIASYSINDEALNIIVLRDLSTVLTGIDGLFSRRQT